MAKKNSDMKTVADLFLMLIEQHGSHYLRSRVKKIRAFMKYPEWKEFFEKALLDSMGYPVQINERTLDKAIDCTIELLETDIEESRWSDESEKMRQKSYMHAFMEWYRDIVKRELLIRGRLLDWKK